MTKLNGWKLTIAACLLCAATAIPLRAQTFTTLLRFNGSNGDDPVGGLVQGIDGNFYGTTSVGGAYSKGTAFTVTPSGKLTAPYSFCSQTGCPDGFFVVAGLLLATDGSFFGVTFGGGANAGGTVFKITASGTLTTLYSFCSQEGCPDGEAPGAALIQATDGNFYGITTLGGNDTCPEGCGTIFRITGAGILTTLHSFNGFDGAQPTASLVQGTDGNFYGTAYFGGANTICNNGPGYISGCGTVFKITPSGRLTTLYKFCSQGNDCADGKEPASELVQATDGNFYGTAVYGGSGNCNNGGYAVGCGTVFKITSSGTLTTLHSFDGTDGALPYGGLIQATDGNFYGTTVGVGNNLGTVFQITPGGTLTTLHTFCSESGCTDGSFPSGALAQDTNGNFYGVTQEGGDLNDCGGGGCGTVFSVSTGLSPFVAFVKQAGRPGGTAGILGQGFTGATSVSFNGIPATFTVRRDTFLVATVPAGATTGYVTVTTPSGTLTSNVQFHVLP